jgi:GT2 family glycosyltransferase
VLLLNPDTILQEGAIDRLIQCMDAHPGVFAAGPQVHNRDGSLQRTGVRFPSIRNIFFESLFLDRAFPRSRVFGAHKALYDDPATERSVDYVQGSCLIVRAEAIARVGILDEDFFMYFEETDWCYRMRQAGGKVLICPSASVIHFGGEESSHYGEQRLLNYHRSLLQFFAKHHSLSDRLLLRIVLSMRCCVRMAAWLGIFLARGQARVEAASSLRGYWRTLLLVVAGRAA